MSKSFLVLLGVALLILFVSVAFAEEQEVLKDKPHVIVINDPLGDNTGDIDVKRMVMVFSNVTGDYTIYLKSQGTNKFDGDFRININLFTLLLWFGESKTIFRPHVSCCPMRGIGQSIRWTNGRMTT